MSSSTNVFVPTNPISVYKKGMDFEKEVHKELRDMGVRCNRVE